MQSLPNRKIELSELEQATCAAVKQLRLDLAMSQPAFARQVGCSVRSIKRWERGTYVPEARFLPRLAQLARMNTTLDLRDMERRPTFRNNVA
jgi:DNA-binding transcriptional regulator YiaG